MPEAHEPMTPWDHDYYAKVDYEAKCERIAALEADNERLDKLWRKVVHDRDIACRERDEAKGMLDCGADRPAEGKWICQHETATYGCLACLARWNSANAAKKEDWHTVADARSAALIDARRERDEARAMNKALSDDIEAMRENAARIASLEAEVEEQCRLNGAGAEREAKLIADRDTARRERDKAVAESDRIEGILRTVCETTGIDTTGYFKDTP